MGIRERGTCEGEGRVGRDNTPRRNTYRDNYVTFCFATARDFFLASVPASWRDGPIGPSSSGTRLASGRAVSRPKKRAGVDEGVNANEFTVPGS